MAVLITGGSSGIGFALAEQFAKNGYDLVLVSRDKAKLLKAAGDLSKRYGAKADTFVADLSNTKEITDLYKWTKKQSIRVDVLVNNAGFGNYGLFVETSLDTELNEIDLNIRALTQLTKLFAQDMKKQGEGKILNVASIAAFMPGPYMAVYYASKSYVLSFSLALHQEMKQFGVTVTALCPGPTVSNFDKKAGLGKSNLFKGKLMSAEAVAIEGYKGLAKDVLVVTPGVRNKLYGILSRILPRRILLNAVQKAQAPIKL